MNSLTENHFTRSLVLSVAVGHEDGAKEQHGHQKRHTGKIKKSQNTLSQTSTVHRAILSTIAQQKGTF